MNQVVQKFIEENIELLDSNNFDKLYQKLHEETVGSNVSELTEVLIAADIDPLEYLRYVPESFMEMSMYRWVPEMPQNIRYIAKFAFYASDVMDAIIPGHIKFIGERAFESCAELETLKIFHGCEELRESCFCDCNQLQNIELPSSIKRIDNYCFSECEGTDHIKYIGTKQQWEHIVKGKDIFLRSTIKKIVCTDGVLAL